MGNRKSDKPRIIAVEVTRRCRFNCRHCRANAGCADNEKELTTKQCKRILASIADFTSLPLRGAPLCGNLKQGCVVILTGGEPIERDDIYELIQHGRKLGLRMVMATCGYLINDQSVTRLKEAGILALSFSLDGADAKTHDIFRQTKGAFDLTVKAAETADRAAVRFQINTTISKINIGQVAGIAKLAGKLGAYCFNPFILVLTGRAQKLTDAILQPAEYEELLNELLDIRLKSAIEMRVTCGPQFARICRQANVKQLSTAANGCMGGAGFGFISYRGDVQTCGFLDISAGNLIENNFDFGGIWMDSEFLKQIRNRSAYKGNCGICEYVGICGGCRARAFAMTGDYLAADPVCSYGSADKTGAKN